MASERTKRQLDRLLDEAEEPITEEDWSTVASRARAVLRLDPGNSGAGNRSHFGSVEMAYRNSFILRNMHVVPRSRHADRS